MSIPRRIGVGFWPLVRRLAWNFETLGVSSAWDLCGMHPGMGVGLGRGQELYKRETNREQEVWIPVSDRSQEKMGKICFTIVHIIIAQRGYG